MTRRRRTQQTDETRLLAEGPAADGQEAEEGDGQLADRSEPGLADPLPEWDRDQHLRRDVHVLSDGASDNAHLSFEIVPGEGRRMGARESSAEEVAVRSRAGISPSTSITPRQGYSFGVVVLTQGKRPEDLSRGLLSLLAQKGVTLDIICVGNGWEPEGLPDGVRTLALPENLGIPAGRNEGVPHVSGEFLFFLDDDAWLPDDTTLLTMAQMMRAKPHIGLIQPRVMDPEYADAPRRWIPRLRKGSAEKSSNVFSVWEGAVCLQRRAFDESGGWPSPFWYAHEGIELAWRVWDAGYQVWYAGDLRVAHPVMDPKRHDEYYYMNARNRVWLARRNLPFPFSWAYVGSWTAVQCLRWAKHPDQLRTWFSGWRDGWRQDPWSDTEEQRKLSGRGLLAMSVHGRPPVV
jgi:GT2 family glycosyltransferase